MIESLKSLCSWQDMEDAPKDGSDIIILDDRSDMICIGSWIADEEAWMSHVYAFRSDAYLTPIGWRPK